MKKKMFLSGFTALLCGLSTLSAQVTIGSDVVPKTTLDIIGDTANVHGKAFRLVDGNQAGGRFLISDADGVGTWTDVAITFFVIQTQPQKFTFYENPAAGAPAGVTGGSTILPLTALAASSNPAPITYQWYKITNKNLHAPLSVACTATDGAGFNAASFTPNVKGTTVPSGLTAGDTRDARNTGMYRYFCRMTDGNGVVLDSEIAEVAVGCGAKNIYGEWVSFMCFNLGADNNSTIASQRTSSLAGTANDATSGLHTYVAGEENLYGDLFQWGRIADGHEERQSPTLAIGTIAQTHIGSGKYCSTTDTQVRPWNQVKPSSGHSNKFILSNATTQNNWQPLTDVTIIDMLWRPSGYAANDPCAHFQPNGTYHPFWNDEGSGVQTGGPACGPVVTWRTPSQDEWANIYRGGTLVGSPANALANTWTWKSGSGNFARGFGISPTNSTATDVETLFLPATGSRISGNGNLYNAGSSGHYWSSSFVSTMAYGLGFNSGTVNPAGQSYRGAGFALRCIRN